MFGPGIGQHPEALVDQAVIVEGFERPHDGFHEIQVHGFVAVIEIDPPGLPGDVGFPFLRVLQHALGAVLVEFFQAHGLDLAFVFDTQLFFGLQFGGQAVAVPTEYARHLVAAHGFVPGDDVFDVAGQQVPIVW